MMYKVLVNKKTLYVPGDQEAVIYDPVAELAVGDAGQFKFEIPEVNPLYNELKNRQSMVQIFRNGKEIFYGEIRTQKKGSLNTKQVTCVGALAFLFDSIQPQAEYHDLSPRQMLETWLNIHNNQVEKRKQIKIGIVTIHDSNDSLHRYTDQENTLECIRYKLVERLGGVLRLRHTGEELYLDWINIEEYGKFCSQPIMFGENLMDYSETLDSSDLITACIPRGARLDKKEGDIQALEKYVDITSVNGGKDYVYVQEAVDRFGWVYGLGTWDDVTLPGNLKKKAEEYVRDTQYESLVLELTAVDESLADVDIESIEVGDRVKVKAKPYGMDKNFPVYQITLHLQAPEEDTFVIGSTGSMTYTQTVSREQHMANMQTEENNRITTDWMQSAVDNLTQMMTGSEGGYKIEEYNDENRWLRTLIMDAPRKEDAKNILQFNKYGIGGSHNGFDGPYTVGMTISGDLIGERLLAGSVKTEALSSEYRASVTNEINTTVTAKFKVAENLISAEVTRAKGEEAALKSSLTMTDNSITAEVSRAKKEEAALKSSISIQADQIALKVTADQVNSLIEQKADSIRLKANKISWKSTYSSMSENGHLACKSADLEGEFRCGSGYYLKLIAGKIRGGYGDDQYGYIDYSASAVNVDTGETYKGIQIQGGCLRIAVNELATRKTDDAGQLAYIGATGHLQVVTDVEDNGDGTITWHYRTISFENGLMTTSL